MRRGALTTWAAIALALLMTIPYIGIFVQTVRAAVDPESVPIESLQELAFLGAQTRGDEVVIAFSYMAVVLGAVSLVVVGLIIGLIARRQAAREAAYAVFGVIGFVAGLACVGGLVGGGWSRGSLLGVVTAAGCAAVIVLLAVRATSLDFERAEMARRRSG